MQTAQHAVRAGALLGVVAMMSACTGAGLRDLSGLSGAARLDGSALDAASIERDRARAASGFVQSLSSFETRQLLPNHTDLVGDNYILYQDYPAGVLAGHLTAMLARQGALPPLFEFAIARDFQVLNDSDSPIYHIVRTQEGGVTCVFAIRRILFVGLQAIPATRVRTKAIRNCVKGNVTQALAPIRGQAGLQGA